MDLDFDRAVKRLEKDHERRVREAREKAERDRKAREEKRKRDEALEASIQAMREERRREQEAQLQYEAEQFARTGGVDFWKRLVWTPRRARLDQSGGDVNAMETDEDEASGGDKICLPPSALDELSKSSEVQYPLYFEVSTIAASSKTTHAGVLEFTAEEGTVQLPKKVIRSLGLHNPETSCQEVKVKYVRLPKGSYARLKVLPPSTGNLKSAPSPLLDPEHQDELRSVLESALRLEYATLTVGDVLPITLGASSVEVEVLELQPNPAVSILETELAVDIVYTTMVPNPDLPKPATEQKKVLAPAQEGDDIHHITFPPSEPSATSTTLHGKVSKGEAIYFKIKPPAPAPYLPPAISFTLEVTPSTTPDEVSDVDLFIAPHPTRRPTLIDHVWSTLSASLPTKQITIGLNDFKSHGDKAFYLAAIGYSGKDVELQLQVAYDLRENKETTTASTASSQPSEDTATCENCGQQIPKANVTTHLMYCLRHNAKCTFPGCGAVMRATDLRTNHWHCSREQCSNKPACNNPFERAKHEAIYHSSYTCPQCGSQGFELDQIRQHTRSECPERLIHCRFCQNYVRAGKPLGADADFVDKAKGLTSHESKCGSRTVPCDICHHPVVLKMMEHHLETIHPPSSFSSTTFNAPTGRTPPSANPADVWQKIFPSLPTSTPTPASTTSFQPQPRFQPPPQPRPQAIVCPICNHPASNQLELDQHIDSEHLAPSTPTPTPQPTVPSANPSTATTAPPPSRHFVECPICTQHFPSERVLGVHIDSEHAF